MRYTISTDFGALNPNFMVIWSTSQWFLRYEDISILYRMSNVPKFDKKLLYEFFTELDHEIHYVH
jgi:hypothetical protein